MSNYHESLIEIEENSDYQAHQESLFHTFFERWEIEEITLELRGCVDEIVRQLAGTKLHTDKKSIKGFTTINQYPFGFCNEITHSISAILKWHNFSNISLEATQLARLIVKTVEEQEILFGSKFSKAAIVSRIQKFEKLWGVFWPVWGVMPSEDCFQWFILAGNHALNVANDAGDRQMFPIEVEPKNMDNYRSIQSYQDYIAIAQKYWWLETYRNTIIPSIAPLFPIVSIDTAGNLHFPRPSILQYRTLRSKFDITTSILKDTSIAAVPHTIKKMCHDICVITDENLDASIRKWWDIIEEPQNSEHRIAQFQRAQYIVEWLEYEWSQNHRK